MTTKAWWSGTAEFSRVVRRICIDNDDDDECVLSCYNKSINKMMMRLCYAIYLKLVFFVLKHQISNLQKEMHINLHTIYIF